MSLPQARTDDEVRLYLSLRPCVCGEPELADLAINSEDAGEALVTKRFSGHCADCGRHRQFGFQMPRTTGLASEVQYGVGDEPSRLLDAGEWRGAAELYAVSAQEAIESGDLDVVRVYYALMSAVAAIDEVFKFLPPGEESIPESALLSRDGRMVYEAAPERLTRQQLTADRDELRALLDDFVEKYGEPAEDDAD